MHRDRQPPDNSTFTSTVGMVFAVVIEAIELARHLEVDPERQPDALAAYGIASRLKVVLRREAYR